MPNANQNKNYTNKDFNKDLEELNRMMHENTNRTHCSNQEGGADGKRSYKLVEVNGKRVSTGRYHGDSPSTAATRVFRSLVLKEDKEPGDGFTKTFVIKETTRGSGKKEYGPYVGKRSKRAKPITFKRGGETIVSKFVNEVVMKEMKGGQPLQVKPATSVEELCNAVVPKETGAPASTGMTGTSTSTSTGMTGTSTSTGMTDSTGMTGGKPKKSAKKSTKKAKKPAKKPATKSKKSKKGGMCGAEY
jgi:hypothetical protein